MANERLPNERYPAGMNRPDMSARPGTTGADNIGDADMTGMPGAEYERAARMDSQLQPDPELTESRSSPGRMAAYAVGIAILLGAVFYGLTSSSNRDNQASNAPASQSASPQPSGTTNAPGVTTGSANNRAATPAAPSAPTNNGK
ncbi:hypothetical protein SSBR45G_16150 [Bradyrhizobium sp. SSBR45G]|uniref:hypothetical protein n=1 Tax=unclassified Bradyrhizobium TaxID=2631580 RepID=UPI0023428D8C|nr:MULTISPECIES: hypothetical protein [unclassified Bradyrhizobium]GLH76707.1 hypothetical protein SSBR45G_16150 [Bradyrhizobium sp. SSBR45G]GLH84320.1 hypothetical protein SSBR45R_17800 [Bradyrhizobium sp. SSBR45R]